MSFRDLRLDHATADLYAFIKTHGRDEHSPFLESFAGWGLVTLNAEGCRRDIKFNIQPFEGHSQKALLPTALAALASVQNGEHIHFISDQDYFVKMLNQGAQHRADNEYRRQNKKLYADADLWREFDSFATKYNIRISAGQPVSDYAKSRLYEASRLGSRSAKYAGERPRDWDT